MLGLSQIAGHRWRGATNPNAMFSHPTLAETSLGRSSLPRPRTPRYCICPPTPSCRLDACGMQQCHRCAPPSSHRQTRMLPCCPPMATSPIDGRQERARGLMTPASMDY